MEKDDKATVFNETKKYATGNKFLPAINYIYSILIVLFTLPTFFLSEISDDKLFEYVSDALAAVASSVYKIGMGLLASVEASARELEAKTAELDVASLVFFVLSHKSFPCVITSNS